MYLCFTQYWSQPFAMVALIELQRFTTLNRIDASYVLLHGVVKANLVVHIISWIVSIGFVHFRFDSSLELSDKVFQNEAPFLFLFQPLLLYNIKKRQIKTIFLSAPFFHRLYVHLSGKRFYGCVLSLLKLCEGVQST